MSFAITILMLLPGAGWCRFGRGRESHQNRFRHNLHQRIPGIKIVNAAFPVPTARLPRMLLSRQGNEVPMVRRPMDAVHGSFLGGAGWRYV